MKRTDDDPRWQALRAQLRPARRMRWVALAVEGALLAACLVAIGRRPELWWTYLGTLAAMLAWFYLVPALLWAWFTRPEARVGPHGDSWQIGRYSEAELRRLVDEVVADLPPRLRRVEVRIVQARCPMAWTTLSLLWPDRNRKKSVSLTSGSLHYLSPEELKGVLLHEIGHHLPEHRISAPGGWLLADVTLHAVVFWFAATWSLGGLGVPAFMLVRAMLVAAVAGAACRTSQAVEHLCDRFAASRIGSPAVINALLKMGEDEELTEVVLVWVAKEMLYDQDRDMDELSLAFEDARPFGRIFHENLLRHAAETVKILRGEDQGQKQQKKQKKSRQAPKPNPELEAFIQQRRDRHIRRVRWRSFDADKDGQLTADEIATLCDALRRHPDHVLVTSHGEAKPTIHPPFRERVLLLEEPSPHRFD